MTSQTTTAGRPDWDHIWATLATMLSERSTCTRAKVGCVVVTADNHRILSIGYNGNARGLENTCDSSEPGNCGCIHAEDNAMIKLDYNDLNARVLYTTTSPCSTCAKRIVNARIREVVYINEYRKTEGIDILRRSGILVRKHGSQSKEEVQHISV